jgi:hypothetical protein
MRMPRTLVLVYQAPTLAERMRAAMRTHGHTQAHVVRELHDKYGAPERTQPSMSRYINGRQRPTDTMLRAFERYLADNPPRDLGQPAATDAFAATVSELTGEPMFGPRQGALIDAAIHRFAAGAATTPSDVELYRVLSQQLGLPHTS